MSSLDLGHQLRGKTIVYVLALQPGEDGKPRRYVGSSSNVERRMAEHTGMKSGGAAFCKKFKPIDVISVKCVDSAEEAAAMEVMLCSLHMAEVGVQACRGGRWNMSGDMKRRPPYFDECEFQSPRSDEAAPPTPEEEPKQKHNQQNVVTTSQPISGQGAPQLPPAQQVIQSPAPSLIHSAEPVVITLVLMPTVM